MGSGVPPKWKLKVTRQRPDGTIFRRGMLATDVTLDKAKQWLRMSVRKEYGQQDEVNDLVIEPVKPGEFVVPVLS